MAQFEEDEAAPELLWRSGDLVWVRVQSFPSWPGQVMDPKYANKKVRKGEQPNMTLVSFFGDASYGWFYNDVILDFEAFYEEHSKQVASNRSKKAFKAAVEEAKEVYDRRSGAEPATNHQPLDFLEPGAFSEVDPDGEGDDEPVVFVPRVSEVKNCPNDVVLSWARALAQDPLGVMDTEDATLDAALNEMWACSCAIRMGIDEEEEKRGRGRKRRGKGKKKMEDVEDEEYVPDDKEGAENQPDVDGNRMSVDGGEGSGDGEPGEVDVYAFNVEDDEPPASKPRRRRSVRKTGPKAAKKKVEEDSPPVRVGRKFVARKKKRARRKADDRVKFELPEHFDDIEITCTPEEVRNWALELGRDPLGRGVEKKEGDGVADPDQGGVMRWEVPEIALIRCRQKLFKTRGGGPRKSSLAGNGGDTTSGVTPKKPRQSRKRASETPKTEKKPTKARKSVVKEGSAKKTPSVGGKRKSSASLAEPGDGGVAAVAATKKAQKKDFSGEPSRAERAVVHVQFPQDVAFPSIPQVHLFVCRRFPGLPTERLFPKTKEHKMTVIFPSAEVAKEGSTYFVEKGPQFFHMAEGSIFTATSGYVPGGTKNNSKEGNSDSKPERRNTGGGGGLPAANYIIPTTATGTQTTLDMPSNPNAVSVPIPHYVPTGAAPGYPNSQIQTIPVVHNVAPINWMVANQQVGQAPPQIAPPGPDLSGQIQQPVHSTQMMGNANSGAPLVVNDNPMFATDPRVKVDGKEVEQGSELFNALHSWEKGPDPGEGPSQW